MSKVQKSPLFIPDIWQQEAIGHLLSGDDVIIDAPTGSGKTFVFEKWNEKSSRHKKAIYTVPTRALANDKMLEWKAKGWNVGIRTGDVACNLNAPVVVATLETQRHSLLIGEGPDLLVIDEYQMLNDEMRGLNYELAIASAPLRTQLLLLSGSTGNPQDIQLWLQRLGRKPHLIRCHQRPVPQEEIPLDQLRHKLPQKVIGTWPKRIAKALQAGLGPILLFCPFRKNAEELARLLATELPHCEPLELNADQRKIARSPLSKMLARRVAYHHSGIDYKQRAGLIEPLAKAGELRVIVATTGLAAGINFSVRSVLVTDRKYRHGKVEKSIRPDELLQMFGRAGRRGLDETGYVLHVMDCPRLREARPITLVPNRRIDWQACLASLHDSAQKKKNPRRTLEALNRNFFSDGKLNLGLNEKLPSGSRKVHSSSLVPEDWTRNESKEMLTPDLSWERLGKKRKVPLQQTYIYENDKWHPTLCRTTIVKEIPVGSLCRLPDKTYGRLIMVARFPEKEGHRHLNLSKWFYQELHKLWKEEKPFAKPKKHCSLETLEERYFPWMEAISKGGRIQSWEEDNGAIRVYLQYAHALTFAYMDSQSRGLLAPPTRMNKVAPAVNIRDALGGKVDDKPRTPARYWYDLELMDDQYLPTRRGIIFSFFYQGEGLAVAAALEDESFSIVEIIYQLANLRAGYRFEDFSNNDSRLGDVCRMTYQWRTIPGYLFRGVPYEYGEGAAEIIAALHRKERKAKDFVNSMIDLGDIERAMLEWSSIVRQIANAPDYDWQRWRDLKTAASSLSNIQIERPNSPRA